MAVNGATSKEVADGTEIPDDDDHDTRGHRPSTHHIPAPRTPRRRLPIALIAIVVIAAVGITAVVLSSSSSSKKPAPATGIFIDQKANFRMTYPPDWTVAKSIDANVPLLLNIGANGLDTLLVRVFPPLQGTVNTNNVADIKAVTDAVISGVGVNVRQQQSLTVNGLPGYYYFYLLPTDPSTGVTLVHSVFFIFPPHEMISLTFQTIDHDFTGLSNGFAQVVSSFHTAS